MGFGAYGPWGGKSLVTYCFVDPCRAVDVSGRTAAVGAENRPSRRDRRKDSRGKLENSTDNARGRGAGWRRRQCERRPATLRPIPERTRRIDDAHCSTAVTRTWSSTGGVRGTQPWKSEKFTTGGPLSHPPPLSPAPLDSASTYPTRSSRVSSANVARKPSPRPVFRHLHTTSVVRRSVLVFCRLHRSPTAPDTASFSRAHTHTIRTWSECFSGQTDLLSPPPRRGRPFIRKINRDEINCHLRYVLCPKLFYYYRYCFRTIISGGFFFWQDNITIYGLT